MKPQSSPKPALVPFADAPVNEAFGDTIRFHLMERHTAGAFTMFTDTTPPGGGPPPHFHVTEDEWWFVLEGQAEFFDGTYWTPVAAGGAVFMPKNAPHTFRNAGDIPLKQVIHTSPSGFERFFGECHNEFHKAGPPDQENLIRIGGDHGICFYTLVPEDWTKRGNQTLQPAIVQAGEGNVLHAFGGEAAFLLQGAHTNGQFTSFIETTPPGGGPPPHYHDKEDEWFYVLDGRVSFFIDGQWTDAHPGDAVFAPKQSVHAFRNNTDRPTRMLIHASPSGFEEFFAEAAAEFARPAGPDRERAIAIAARHGIHFVHP